MFKLTNIRTFASAARKHLRPITTAARASQQVATAEGTPASLGQIRPEYAQQMEDFEQLLSGTKQKALDYYELCGNP